MRGIFPEGGGWAPAERRKEPEEGQADEHAPWSKQDLGQRQCCHRITSGKLSLIAEPGT